MKGIEFHGRWLDAIRSFPVVVKREAGYQLDRVQRGLDPIDRKPMPSIGKTVREIRIRQQGQYRVIYIAAFAEVVHVLHAFVKKTQKTRKQDTEAATRALKQIPVRDER
jgi:phage-related protein